MYTETFKTPNQEFRFIVDGNRYDIAIDLVVAFSQVIAEKLKKNPSSTTYKFDKLRDPDHDFLLIVSLFNGETIEINEKNAFFIGYVADTLGIPDLSQKADQYRQTSITSTNIFHLLANLGKLNITDSRIVSYAGQNWTTLLGFEESLRLPLAVLNTIFNEFPQALTFEYIVDIIEKSGHEYVDLFKFCDLTLFSPSQMKKFIDLVSLDEIPLQVLQQVIPRLTMELAACEEEEEEEDRNEEPQNKAIPSGKDAENYYFGNDSKLYMPARSISTPNKPFQDQNTQMQNQNHLPKTSSGNVNSSKTSTGSNVKPIQSTSQPKKSQNRSYVAVPKCLRKTIPSLPISKNYVDVEYHTDCEFDGVVAMLQRENPNSWMRDVIIRCPGSKESLKYTIFEFDEYSWWDNYDGKSCKMENAWIIVGFPRYTLRLKSYTLSSIAERKNVHQPASWKIYGSVDGEEFTDLITFVENAQEMNQPSAVVTFDVPSKPKPYSYFKFQMTKNFATRPSAGSEFSISGLELFGILTAK
ncbi:hypothetical protein TRFO_30493 [Tritrichomonas foetus]|uniref:Uncharacterized protein n=1 Tax=Tritrichomonas foetus TaxID=1144522 RepID=A0A1J4JUP0_9EUKA|nr:hypothetical protein TRFO_30493 [Tritrichomonas foetus]|eukprot:OHT02426.1 hypothetical protein TRFO_30493 [Tritrichomonas foetus]